MRAGPLNRWDVARETLTDLLAWLEDTRQWAAAAVALEEPRSEERRVGKECRL